MKRDLRFPLYNKNQLELTTLPQAWSYRFYLFIYLLRLLVV